MELSKEHIDKLATHILVSDVLSYINNNRSKYEEFLKNEQRKEEKNDYRRIKTKTTMDKLELQGNQR